MKNKPHIVCLLWEQGMFLRKSAVLKSQALGQMMYLKALGADITIICSDPSPSEFKKEFGKELDSKGIHVILIKQISNPSVFNFLMLPYFYGCLRNLHRIDSVDFVYMRNFWNALALPANQFEVVFDLRGANVEETVLKKKGGDCFVAIKNVIYSFVERHAMKRADYLQCVSLPLKDYISNRFNRRDAHVVNSCLSAARFQNCRRNRKEIRSLYGISEKDIVFLYSGGMAGYQELDFMLLLWSRLSNYIKNSFFLLFTGSNHESLKKNDFIKSIPDNRIVITSIAYDNIPKHISAADFGFLLRQNIILNKVASPVKFSEYLAAGLGVITSPNIGDMSKLVADNDIGCLIDMGDLEQAIKRIRDLTLQYNKEKSDFSRRAQHVAKQYLTWDAYKSYYLRRYFLKNID